MAAPARILTRTGIRTAVTTGLDEVLRWSGATPGRCVHVGAASPEVSEALARISGPGGLVVVDPDPRAVAALRARLAAAGRAATVLEGRAESLPVAGASVDLAWVDLARTDRPKLALAEAVRITRPGGTVVVRQQEQAGEPPMAQAERLGDCLALAGLTGVATLVSLELVRSDGAADGAWGQVAATLQEGLSAARLLRLATAAMARGVVA